MTDPVLLRTVGGAHRPILRAIDATAPRSARSRFGLTLPLEAIRTAGGKVAGLENTVGNRDDHRQDRQDRQVKS